MEEKDFNPIVKMFFQDHGFTANEIPREKDKQTPDFDVIGKNDRYTVELKIKSDDPNEIARDNEFLSKGQMVTKSIPIGPRNRLSGIIQKGVDQMTTHDPQRKTYQVIWIHTIGKNQDLLNTRFRSTLFGLEKLFSIDISHVITCYYFHNSAFLHGVIILMQHYLQQKIPFNFALILYHHELMILEDLTFIKA
jgi:hypothetical protein